MFKIRVVTTGSKSKAVQVVSYYNNKRKVIKHFGSCKTEDDLTELTGIANEWINDHSDQLSLFNDENSSVLLHINHCSFLGVYYTFLYEILVDIQHQIGFDLLNQNLLIDLTIIRIVEPASKLHSIELLDTYFGIKHQRKNYCKLAPYWLSLKSSVEAKVFDFATHQYGFNCELLFYDVTTLYFESFDDDELRKKGFSKDSKSQQTQILVALLVTKEGFPIGYEIFAGNTFEGHTIIPVINKFIANHNIKHLTVVADAAMISTANVAALIEHKIHYIVGARLGNLSAETIDKIDKAVSKEDGNNIRIKTINGSLICSYSATRYRKDKHEMEKQIEKAKQIITQPSKNRKVKFTQTENEKITLNQSLIEKTTKLLGIKGYYTDLDEIIASNELIIGRYHELYKIEQAFRISKSDLQTRPIFHFKEEPIKLHMLICFMALAVSKHIELKTQSSIKRFLTECKKVTDARMLNDITGKEFKIRAVKNNHVTDLLKKLTSPH